jgi:hypothetical protein
MRGVVGCLRRHEGASHSQACAWKIRVSRSPFLPRSIVAKSAALLEKYNGPLS